MDWLVWITLLVVLVVQFVLLRKINDLNTRLRVIGDNLKVFILKQQSRQSVVTKVTASNRGPTIDSKVRVTKRDTNDIPLRGAKIVKIKRVKSHGRQYSDS